jgi:pilus assembly protein Flp/PilA
MQVMSTIETALSIAGREVRRFGADESGATAVEYALVASGVGVVIAATVYSLGSGVKNLYTTLSGLFPSS